jgi:hypothetical protein
MTKMSVERQGGQLLHVIGLLTRCLEISHRSASLRTAWERDLLKAREELEALHAGGLRRDFMGAAKGAARGPAKSRVSKPRDAGGGEATRLAPWQRELILRLERGLGRALTPADTGCLTWNLSAETMSVVTHPLLGELRANNLTSNVFRRQRSKSARRLVAHAS